MQQAKPWILAARLRTLPAAVAPVLIGCALAWRLDGFNWLPALFCMLFALLVQVLANFANDYFDGVQGRDTVKRIGPTRMVASGRVSPQAMWRAALLVGALSFIVGCGLIPFGGWWLLLVGVVSLLSALAYTGGPYPLGYHGWGELFVLIFFGFVAVTCTVYVQMGDIPLAAWPIAAGVGMLAVNLLVVNNYRDYEEDRSTGKGTLVARFGKPFGEGEYLAGLLTALIGAFLSGYWVGAGLWVLVMALIGSLPGWIVWRNLPVAKTPQYYGKLLKHTAMALIGYGVAVSTTLVMAP